MSKYHKPKIKLQLVCDKARNTFGSFAIFLNTKKGAEHFDIQCTHSA